MVRLLVTAMLVTATTSIFAQDREDQRKRCESILLDAIETSKQPTYHSTALCAVLPLQRVSDHLKIALHANDPSIRVAAADVCVRRSPVRFREMVVTSMTEVLNRFEQGEIQLPDASSEILRDDLANSQLNIPKGFLEGLSDLRNPSQSEVVQVTAILMKLGDKDAKKRIEAWVKHDFSAIKNQRWICPMMCVHPSGKEGKCSVCSMELVQSPSVVTNEDWEAKVEAIRVFHQEGHAITEAARSIVTSEARPDIRLLAADIWSREAPAEARPHVAVFMHGDTRELALQLSSTSMPDEFVEEFATIVKTPEASWISRFSAYDGLLRAGNSEYLAKIRQMIAEPSSGDQGEADKEMAIMLMTEHAEAGDADRLEKLLDSSYRVRAAQALLNLLTKRKVER